MQGFIAHFRRAILAGTLVVSQVHAADIFVTETKRTKDAMVAGKHDEAIKHLTRMIESGEASRLQLGALFAIRCAEYVTIDEYHLAIEDCTESLRLDDAGHFVPFQSSLARLSRCTSYLATQSYDQAIEDCTALIEAKGVDLPTPIMRVKALTGRCASHAALGAYERAVEDCTMAIGLAGTGAIDTPLLALTYSSRCESYLGMAAFESAIVDCTTAIHLGEQQFSFGERGWAHFSLGQLDAAIADFDRALAIDPNDETTHFRRAVAAYGADRFDDASLEFSWLGDVNVSYAYYAIWRFLAQERSHGSGDRHLATFATSNDLNKWPGAVIAYYLGRLTSSDVFALAKEAESEHDDGQSCEANFYVGQFKLLAGETSAAMAMFETADNICPPNFIEPPAARAEIRKLNELPE